MSFETLNTGISHADWDILTKILSPLRGKAKVWIFGSRARGDFKKYSDIDILVEGNDLGEILSKVRSDLEESSLVYKVDLVDVKDLVEDYKKSVFKDRVLVF